MLQTRQIINKTELTQEKIDEVCKKEKEILLQIVPDVQFLDYTLINNKVCCSYRGHLIYKYNISTVDNLASIDLWVPSIYECLCIILCEIAKEYELTQYEENFILFIMNNREYKRLHFIILNNYQFFSQILQKKLKIYAQTL